MQLAVLHEAIEYAFMVPLMNSIGRVHVVSKATSTGQSVKVCYCADMWQQQSWKRLDVLDSHFTAKLRSEFRSLARTHSARQLLRQPHLH